MDFRFHRTILFRVFIFVFSILGFVSPIWGIEPQEILSRSLEAQFQLDLEGIKKTTKFHTHQENYILTARFIRLGPNFSYLLYLSPSKFKGRVILDDGSSRKDYIPHNKKLKIYPSLNCSAMEERRRENLGLLLTNYTVSRQPDEFILDRPSYVISLIPRHPGNPRLDVYVDKRTYFPLKKERYNAEGRLIISSSFISFDLREESSREGAYRGIPRILEEERAPSFPLFYTLQEIGKVAKFPLTVPEYLPPGYVLQGASMVDEGIAVKLTYTNGLGVICFFQRPRANIKMGNFRRLRFGSLEGKIRVGDGEKTFVWNKSGMTFVLIGDILETELRRIVESVN